MKLRALRCNPVQKFQSSVRPKGLADYAALIN